ncbi:MAG: hypothetical protein CL572_01410 [Alphaproteobacteria bacterium]|nr:hypothetical protein [Alphaproteobacteria bacterium]
MKFITKIVFLFFLTFSSSVISDEIIQDRNGNYFLMKDDGTFVKLPKPKPGNKYVIQKKKVKKVKKNIVNEPKKKARRRTNQGIR